MSRKLNNMIETPRYDSRILGKTTDGSLVTVTNDTCVTFNNNNTCVIASSGAGKTGSYLYANIKNLQNESAIISDSKGLLRKMFEKELKAKGYNVRVLSLIDWSKSEGYNPFDYIRRHPDGSIRYQDVITLSKTIIPDSFDDEPIWPISAQNIIQFLVGYIMETLPKEDHNMCTVAMLYHAMIENGGLGMFAQWAYENPDTFPSMRYREVMANASAEKMISSIYGFVSAALTPFMLPEGKKFFGAKKTINLRDLGRKKTVLFLEVSDCDHTYDAVQNIVFAQAIQVLFDEASKNEDCKLKVPVNLMMDDFAANIQIDEFDKLISVVRSRDIFVTCILQSLSQLDALYGADKAKTILNCCDTIIFMGCQDLVTAEYIGHRACTNQEKILSMGRDYEYVITAGQKPQLIRKLAPYQYMKGDDSCADAD